jgi:uncharacterized membrane protein
MSSLIIACAVFVGSHLALSHPLRGPLAGWLGARGFQAFYSIIALGTFWYVVRVWQSMPSEAFLWTVGDGLWSFATILMWLASVLLVGSLVGNPALPAPRAAAAAARLARGVFAITRHPMMWGFALWGAAHILVMPSRAQIVLAGSIILLALLGSWGQDSKKARLMGAAWQSWVGRTAFIPFVGQLTGRLNWADAMPRPIALVGGTALWIAATWSHGALGYRPAGIWLWF